MTCLCYKENSLGVNFIIISFESTGCFMIILMFTEITFVLHENQAIY